MKKISMTLLAALSLSFGLAVCSCTDEIKGKGEELIQDWKIALNNKVKDLKSIEGLAKVETGIKEIIKGHSADEVKNALDESIPEEIRNAIIAWLTVETPETTEP